MCYSFQKALKEKEEHIEQLLRERDLERSEVARAAAHVDEVKHGYNCGAVEIEFLISVLTVLSNLIFFFLG